MNYIIYNPLSFNGKGEKIKDKAIAELNNIDDVIEYNFTELNYDEFADKVKPNDNVFLVGGDGTIHFFANYYKKKPIDCSIFVYEGGCGNDFLKDLNYKNPLVKVNGYFDELPTVTVNGETRYFINNVGFGLDGAVSLVSDKKKSKHKKINYTFIAIIQLLFKYRRCNAKVIIDGKELNYKKVWLAPTMNGRFYGGGMMIAPSQKRERGMLTLVVVHNRPRIATLLAFTKVFKGTHEGKFTKSLDMIRGHEIEVIFDKPRPLQIDGETINNVISYKCKK